MKAIIKKTGEIINIASYDKITLDKCSSYGDPVEVDYKDVSIVDDDFIDKYVDKEAVAKLTKEVTDNILSEVEKRLEENKKEIDWEQRRYEIIREFYCNNIYYKNTNFYSRNTTNGRDYDKYAIRHMLESVDILIEELKKGKSNE